MVRSGEIVALQKSCYKLLKILDACISVNAKSVEVKNVDDKGVQAKSIDAKSKDSYAPDENQ